MTSTLDWRAEATSRLDSLAKPPGALGTLESFAVTLCHQQATLTPSATPAAVLIFCADHGVKAQVPGLSPFPPGVTQSIFRALAAGVAGAAVLARSAGASCTVVDVGIDGQVDSVATAAGCFVRHDKLAHGTCSMLDGEAMGDELCARAIAAGRAAVDAEVDVRGARVVAIGEVGIGNTTAAAAMLAALTGAAASECCGRGTGLDEAGVAHKVEVVERALSRHRLGSRAEGGTEGGTEGGGEGGGAAGGEADASADGAGRASARGLRILAAVGGLEIGAMVGAYLQATERGAVAVVDGFISAVAALCAVAIEPRCRDAMVLATASAERGGALVTAALGREKPALDMSLRLGEGSGAALALPLLRAAADLMSGMATLEEAMQL